MLHVSTLPALPIPSNPHYHPNPWFNPENIPVKH